MKTKGEFRRRWMLVSAGVMGLLFSLNTQAQDLDQDSVTYRSETTTTTTQTVDVDTDNDVDDVDRDRNSDRTYDGPRAGIKGGLNLSNLISDNVTDNKVREGFHIGVYGQLFSSPAFTIQPEVNFSTKGNESHFNEGIIDQKVQWNLSYIDIPILAVFKLGRAAEIHVGPYWSYLVGANIDFDGDLSNDFRDVDRDNFEKWDYGLAGGIGFNLGKAAQLGARYNYGMKEIAKSAGSRAILGDAKNSVLQVYLAFNFAARADD